MCLLNTGSAWMLTLLPLLLLLPPLAAAMQAAPWAVAAASTAVEHVLMLGHVLQ
jgi:hypothetical protein